MDNNVTGTALKDANPTSAPVGRASIEGLLEGLRLTEPQFAPEGQRLAVAVASGFSHPGQAPRSQIWLVGLDGHAEPVTSGDRDSHPRWSPDGSQLAFASKGKTPEGIGLQLLTLDSGEVRRFRTGGDGIADIAWSPDGRELLVLATDVGSAANSVVKADGGDSAAFPADPQVHRPTTSWRHLFRIVVATGQTSPVGPADLSVWEFDWRGGDTVAVVLSADPSENGWYSAGIGVIDLPSATATILHSPQWQVSGPRLSPDRRRVAFLEGICSDRGGVNGVPSMIELPSPGAGVDARQPSACALVSGVEVTALGWRDDNRLWYSGRRGMRATCGSMSVSGAHEERWSGRAVVREVTSSPDGQWLTGVRETHSDPPEVSLFELDSPDPGWRPVSQLNALLATLDLPAVEQLQWTAPDGWEIEGLLVRPRATGDDRAPLVVIVHGGPTAAWSYAFPCGARHAALLADAGYAVLLPNPRGSTGRGQEFARAVVGDLGGAELADTLSGVEACVAAGHADGDRVGIMGASHGGFMTAWAGTQTDRFRAGIAIACVSDFLSLHYTSDIGALDDMLFTGPDRVADYVEHSPIAHLDACATPMLIIHGELDDCCPPGQARELYGGLVERGVETELVLYPREGHGYVEYDHQRDLWRRVNAWFDAHLRASR